MKDKIITIKELFGHFSGRKMWWLLPMIIIFLIFGFLILVVGSSPLAPIIYPLF